MHVLLMDSKFKENFGKLVYQLRIEANIERGDGDAGKPISYRQFWRLFQEKGIDVSYNSFRTWQEGESLPQMHNLSAIAQYMGIDIAELVAMLSGFEINQDISKQDVYRMILDWDFEDKTVLIDKLFDNLLNDLSPEDKLKFITKLSRPS